ncbi:hypothetical protein GCM10022215_42190 [Nocardioides fonticola]|uniref:SseB protein N-terminal domain-containing protein n=1 Tax=Nocardioides fonticola TaxID=450363 RepID=A0ABP7Y2K1_9ACTN
MSADDGARPVFATRWDFLFGRVLIGVDPATAQFHAVRSAAGDPLLAMYTSEASVAAAAIPERFRIVQTDVAGRLLELPEGVGVAVDPDTPGGMIVEPAYAAQLKPLAAPFPPGTRSDFKNWPLFPRDLATAIAAAGRSYAFLDAVWGLVYTIDDSPPIGLLVFRTTAPEPEARDSVVDALDRALAQTVGRVTDLGFPLVRIVDLADLAAPVREAIEGEPPVYRAG